MVLFVHIISSHGFQKMIAKLSGYYPRELIEFFSENIRNESICMQGNVTSEIYFVCMHRSTSLMINFLVMYANLYETISML